MKESVNVSPVNDQARRELCRLMVKACEQGASNIKVRVNLTDDQPVAVWVYGRINNRWQKLTTTLDDPQIAAVIAEELERLASAPHVGEWNLRRQELADRIEAEIKFHRETIDAHQGEHFESYLFGLLFYERNGAQQSRRQAIRRGPKAHVAKI